MIFKNKDADKSNLFGDNQVEAKSGVVDPSVLEGFFRKQTIGNLETEKSSMLKNKIARSSKNNDDKNVGEIFLGKNSSRSLFSPNMINEDKLPGLIVKKSNKFLPNVKKEVSEEVANDLLKFKNNFNSASKSAGSHGAIRNDRVSIFDSEPFERIEEKKEEIKKEHIEDRKISKSMSSKDISSSLFDKLNNNNSEKQKTSRQKSLDKMFGDKGE